MYVVNSESVVWRKVEGETIVLNLDTGYYYTLDEVGGYIWELVLERYEPERIVECVVSNYEVDRSTAEADVKTLLHDMVEEGIFGPQSDRLQR